LKPIKITEKNEIKKFMKKKELMRIKNEIINNQKSFNESSNQIQRLPHIIIES